jgi:hypothetical protein
MREFDILVAQLEHLLSSNRLSLQKMVRIWSLSCVCSVCSVCVAVRVKVACVYENCERYILSGKIKYCKIGWT